MKDERNITAPEQSGPIDSELRLMELAERNPSLGGCELLLEIIERGPMPEAVERPRAQDHRAAFKTPGLDDPDYRTPIEQAGWLGKESQMMRDLYERGAIIKDNVLVIPAEEYELLDDHETPFITTLSYALEKIENIEQAREFHSLALTISGETADSRTQFAVFKTYYDRIGYDGKRNRSDQGPASDRAEALAHTLAEMRLLAAEMERFETRESVEAVKVPIASGIIGEPEDHEDRESRIIASGMNTTARKVDLRANSLRFPAGLSYELKERLIGITIPEIDRRLENGASREALDEAIDKTMFQRGSREFTDREFGERSRIGHFLKDYIDERLRDPETRAINTSAAFREARKAIIKTTTLEDLGRTAGSILRENDRRNKGLQLSRSDPNRQLPSGEIPLKTRELKLLFNGRAPGHHTREMRELRLSYGLSQAERSERINNLREGRIGASEALKTLLQELETRRTVKGLAHFQASVLHEEISNTRGIDFYSLHQRLPPHERTYLFELSEERKMTVQRSSHHNHAGNLRLMNDTKDQLAERAFGTAPRGSYSFQQYMSSMGRIERQLLNDAVRRQTGSRDPSPLDREENDLSITDARNLLPEKTRDEIRLKARNLAWKELVPDEIFDKDPHPEALRISDTISHIQENLQERARIAQTARNDFIAEKVRLAEDRLGKTGIEQLPLSRTQEERQQFVRAVLDSLSTSESRRLAELDRHAERTREEVYQGFESIDAQLHDLELARSHIRLNQIVDINSARDTEIKPAVDAHSFVNVGDSTTHIAGQHKLPGAQQEHLNGTSAGRQEIDDVTLRSGYVSTDQEWHFDSLREVLKDAQTEHNDLHHNYSHQLDHRENHQRLSER